MGYKDIIDFLVISVPEQLLMGLFAWVLLGKSERVKLRNVFVVGFIAASVFFLTQAIYLPSISIPLIQALSFAILIYFGYKLSILEAGLGCLVTLVFFTLVQGTTLGIACAFANVSQDEIISFSPIRIFYVYAEFVIISIILLFIYKRNINIYYLKENKLDKSQKSRLGFLVLQLLFAFFILIVIYTMFINNSEVFKFFKDKLLIISSFIITIAFTVLLIRSVFKMGEIIQKEEEVKRRMDGIEMIQNIEYLCSLIDEKQYGELKRVLKSIKNDIETGMIKSEKSANREVLSDNCNS
jgi:hypothetical protein